jgi:hypothetical protein
VPAKSRRGGAFGGSLLAVPTPLPDDEAASPPAADEPAAEPVDAAPPVTEAPQVEDEPVPPTLTVAPDSEPDPEPPVINSSPPVNTGRGDKKPPSTIRLDDKAGHPLFDAFLEAKRLDPFLSYRQFASGIVLDGLTAHRRRQKRG